MIHGKHLDSWTAPSLKCHLDSHNAHPGTFVHHPVRIRTRGAKSCVARHQRRRSGVAIHTLRLEHERPLNLDMYARLQLLAKRCKPTHGGKVIALMFDILSSKKLEERLTIRRRSREGLCLASP
jgi:hypothetical protein